VRSLIARELGAEPVVARRHNANTRLHMLKLNAIEPPRYVNTYASRREAPPISEDRKRSKSVSAASVLLIGTRSADYIMASRQSGCNNRPNT